MRFLDARSQAENARQVLDEALKSPNSEPKAPAVSIAIPESAAESVEVETITEIDNVIVEIPVSKSTKKK